MRLFGQINFPGSSGIVRPCLGLLVGLIMLAAVPEHLGAQQTVLMSETFANDSLASWTRNDQSTSSGPAVWQVEQGSLVQKSNLGGGGYAGTMLLRGDADWQTYALSLRLRNADDDGIGLVFWYRDKDNYFRLRLMGPTYRESVIIEECRAGRLRVLASRKESVLIDTAWHEVLLVCTPARIALWMDGAPEPVLDLSAPADTSSTAGVIPGLDPALAKGRMGLYSWASTGAWFDDIRVVLPPPVLVQLGQSFREVPTEGSFDLDFAFAALGAQPVRLELRLTGLELAEGSSTVTVPATGTTAARIRVRVTPSRGRNPAASLTWTDSRGRECLTRTWDLIPADVLSRIPLFMDLHMHTTYSDGQSTPAEMLIASRRAGMDAVVITDHNTAAGADAGIAILPSLSLDLLVVRGEENPSGLGHDPEGTHILAYGIPPGMTHLRDSAPPEIADKPEELCRWAIAQGILIFQAHPNWEKHGGTEQSRIARARELFSKGIIQGYEIANGGPASLPNKPVIAMFEEDQAAGLRYPVLGSSDAHSAGSVGSVRTLVFVRERSTSAIIEAIRQGWCVVMNRDGSLLYGQPDMVKRARRVIEDYLGAHDDLCRTEADLAWKVFGGHEELRPRLAAMPGRWRELFARHFPFAPQPQASP